MHKSLLSLRPLSPASPLQIYWQGEQPASRQSASLQIQEKPSLSMVLVQGGFDSDSDPCSALDGTAIALSDEPNSVIDVTAVASTPTCVWQGPNEWLMLANGPEAKLIADLQSAVPDSFTLAPLSGSRCVIEIDGEAASRLLEKGCGLDFHPQSFTAGCCAQTLFAQLDVLIYKLGEGETAAYRLITSRGDAEYCWRWLMTASAEFE